MKYFEVYIGNDWAGCLRAEKEPTREEILGFFEIDAVRYGFKVQDIRRVNEISQKEAFDLYSCIYDAAGNVLSTDMVDRVSEAVYVLYKQDWVDQHTTPEERLQNVREYQDYVRECYEEGLEVDSYEDWLEESGFHGALYVCYDEFLDAEYQDVEYVKSLLKSSEGLLNYYYLDVGYVPEIDKALGLEPCEFVRFECNCESEADFEAMLRNVRAEKSGFNIEVGARLWMKPDGFDKVIMVEYQVSTKDCRELTENVDEPDWLTAYEVESLTDDDCSHEIYSETIDGNIQLDGLKGTMLGFAKQVFERCYEPLFVVSDLLSQAEEKSVVASASSAGKPKDIVLD